MNILIGLVRIKIAALLLGPAGVGLIGVLQNLLQAAATLGGFNLGTAGTRHIASAGNEGEDSLRRARQTLFIATAFLTLASGAVFWAVSSPLGDLVLGDTANDNPIAWLSIGVMLMVASGYHVALLTGTRRIADIARASILSSLVAAVIGASALLLWQQDGILVFILATPAASLFFGMFYVRKLGAKAKTSGNPPKIAAVFALLRFGSALTVATFVTLGGQLVVRMFVERELGMDALGHFQAAWLISITYLGFVLYAMTTDYYPRLTAAIDNQDDARRLVNEQTEVALLLGGPVLLVMLGAAPWLIQVLYTTDFGEAATILRWQILGDVLKIASWPLIYVLLARRKSHWYVFTEVSSVIVLVGGTALLLPVMGLEATGVGVLLMYAYYLPVTFLLVRRDMPFSWDRQVARLFGIVLVSCVTVFGLTLISAVGAALMAFALMVLLCVLALFRLNEALPRPLRRFAQRLSLLRR